METLNCSMQDLSIDTHDVAMVSRLGHPVCTGCCALPDCAETKDSTTSVVCVCDASDGVPPIQVIAAEVDLPNVPNQVDAKTTFSLASSSSPRVVNVSGRQYFDVYVGRPSKRIRSDRNWGNPFKVGRDGSRTSVICKYINWIFSDLQSDLFWRIFFDLRGLTLGCWCSPQPCHGDIMLCIANAVFEIGEEYRTIKGRVFEAACDILDHFPADAEIVPPPFIPLEWKMAPMTSWLVYGDGLIDMDSLIQWPKSLNFGSREWAHFCDEVSLAINLFLLRARTTLGLTRIIVFGALPFHSMKYLNTCVGIVNIPPELHVSFLLTRATTGSIQQSSFVDARRDYQLFQDSFTTVKCFHRAVELFSDGESGFVYAPSGAGKSYFIRTGMCFCGHSFGSTHVKFTPSRQTLDTPQKGLI